MNPGHTPLELRHLEVVQALNNETIDVVRGLELELELFGLQKPCTKVPSYKPGPRSAKVQPAGAPLGTSSPIKRQVS